MTYSGVLMLVICAAVARLVFGVARPHLAGAGDAGAGRGAAADASPAAPGSAPVSRSACCSMLKDFRLAALLPVAIALVFALAPDTVTDRMMSMFDLQDPTNRDRVAMLEAGAGMVRDHPLTGVGPTWCRACTRSTAPPTR